MKRGLGVLKQLTYQFEVPYTEFRLEKYEKHLNNKKIRNFIVRKFERVKGDVLNGWITSQRPVLQSTFQNWLDCSSNQLWPAFPSSRYLQQQKDSPYKVFFKYNGIAEPERAYYDVEPVDYIDVPVTESDSDWDVIGSDVGEGGKRIDYNQLTKEYLHALIDANIMNFPEWEVDNWRDYCKRRNFNARKFEDYIWAAYMVFINKNPSKKDREIVRMEEQYYWKEAESYKE